MHSLPRLKCVSLLQQTIENLDCIRQLHAQLITNCLKSQFILAKLIEHYCSIPSPLATQYAHQVLNLFHPPDVYLLNVFIRCALPRRSILAFAECFSDASLVLDDYTYLFALGACARSSSLSALLEGEQIHCQARKHGLLSNVMIQTTTVHFYACKHDVASAKKVFDEMSHRSVVTWNALLTGYCSQKERISEHCFDALVLFRDMLGDISWVRPTNTTLVCALSAASGLGALETGACVHGYVEKTLNIPENDVFIGTGLVDMYAKCGCLQSALVIFWRMREKSVLTWTAMATGLAVHGNGQDALELLDAMKSSDVRPNVVTFTSLLSACCRAGLVEEGLQLFHNMETRFGVTPLIQHYGCIVDLLGRAGHLEEAYKFIKGMLVETDLVLWRSLLSACKVHGNVAMGEKVAKVILLMQQSQCCADRENTCEDYVALSNVYASAERWEDVEVVREVMKVNSIETKPGYSSTHSLGSHLLDVRWALI